MQSQSGRSVTIMQIVMLVVFACCTLFSLITAGLVFNAGQPGSAIFFSRLWPVVWMPDQCVAAGNATREAFC